MSHPVSMQHVLTNSSVAEKMQQSNHAQADGQQKHFMNKVEKEKQIREKKINHLEKSRQMKINKDQEKQEKQEQKSKRPLQNKDEAPTEGSPKIDILV